MGFHHLLVDFGANRTVRLNVAGASAVLHNQVDLIFLDIVNLLQIVAHDDFLNHVAVRMLALLGVLVHGLNDL